nr:reverse transcriptase domain-containing protein [Tanacetum cinerariifolium]
MEGGDEFLGEIISDNGKQFADNPFKDWCDKLDITQHFASVKHPQSNGLVERANRSLGEGIKARLGEGNKNWVEELPHVLWAHRTMIKSCHGDTPFSLTYETEAVIPAEIGMPTYRTTAVDVVNNDEELRLNLDLLEERRELAAMNEARFKSKMMKYYNSRVRGVAFQPGDFVYRSNDASHAVAGGKLGTKWEGAYKVTDALDSVCVAASTNKRARPCGTTIGADTGTRSDLAWCAEPTPALKIISPKTAENSGPALGDTATPRINDNTITLNLHANGDTTITVTHRVNGDTIASTPHDIDDTAVTPTPRMNGDTITPTPHAIDDTTITPTHHAIDNTTFTPTPRAKDDYYHPDSLLYLEGKLIIGYIKNSSESSSNHLPRAAITSTSRVRDANESLNAKSDIMAPRVPVGARNKSVVVGSTSNTSRKKHKTSKVDTPNEYKV